jgi:DNA-binding NarL/FixJ family response regulator
MSGTARQLRQAQPVRVMILEDEEPACTLLRAALLENPRFQLTAQADNVAACTALLREHEVDLLLADLHLPDGCGIAAIRQARALPRPPTVLVVSSLADERHVGEAILAGASGYVCKHDGVADIARSIERAADGGSWISPAIARFLIGLLRAQAPSPEPPRASATTGVLSERECEILRLASKGCSYAQIAELLELKTCTVYTYVRRIYEKLQVSNLAQALFEARALRVI